MIDILQVLIAKTFSTRFEPNLGQSRILQLQRTPERISRIS